MTDPFVLDVFYKGSPREYTAHLLVYGFVHKIQVWIDDIPVWFEPDEEGSYRVVSVPGQDEKLTERLDKNLLQLLISRIEDVLA